MTFAEEFARACSAYITPIRNGVLGNDARGTHTFSLLGTPVQSNVHVLGLFARLLAVVPSSDIDDAGLTCARRYVIGANNALRSGFYISGTCDDVTGTALLHAVDNTPEYTPRDIIAREQDPRGAPRTNTTRTYADAVAANLRKFGVIQPTIVRGADDGDGRCVFYVFGAGASDSKYVTDVFHRILVATKTFSHPAICLRQYVLRDADDAPFLAHGYSVRGLCESEQDFDIMTEALTLSDDWEDYTAQLFIYSANSDGTISVNARRNVPYAAWGNEGMGGVHSLGESRRYRHG